MRLRYLGLILVSVSLGSLISEDSVAKTENQYYCEAHCQKNDIIIVRSATKVAQQCDFSKAIVKISEFAIVCVYTGVKRENRNKHKSR